jgi:hypothetical protein
MVRGARVWDVSRVMALERQLMVDVLIYCEHDNVALLREADTGRGAPQGLVPCGYVDSVTVICPRAYA